MNNNDIVRRTVGMLLDQIGREPLRELTFDPIEPDAIDEYLARLSYYVSPSYLPFADYEGSMLALHTWPDRGYEASPIVFISHDFQEARFVCDSLKTLPAGLWLWVAQDFKDEPETLRRNIELVTRSIPSERPMPESLWKILANSPKYEPTWWSSDCEEFTNVAWREAQVGHPFVGIPQVPFDANPEEAIAMLEPFISERMDVPELLALWISVCNKMGIRADREAVLGVLSAESWRQTRCLLDGMWRDIGKGVCEWNHALHSIDDANTVLAGTPFEPLIDHPDTYSGEDKHGPIALMEVAKLYRQAGDHEAELRQLRNAATLQVLAWGSCRPELAQMIAKTCDTISPGSLAAAVARESARVYPQGP